MRAPPSFGNNVVTISRSFRSAHVPSRELTRIDEVSHEVLLVCGASSHRLLLTGAQAASRQVSAACREPGKWTPPQIAYVKEVAGNHRPAACAPQNCSGESPLITHHCHSSPSRHGLDLGRGVGRPLGVGLVRGVGVGRGVGLTVGVAVGVALGVAVGVTVGLGVGVGTCPPGNTRT
jgi:hypothetical protein